MGWGSSWDKPVKFIDNKLDMRKENEIVHIGWSTHQDDAAFLDLHAKQAEQNFRVNLVPTHDPYTNPGAFLYYECDCGKVLDPKVKRFASLNNHASDAGWKIRFGEKHYVPYCPECAEKKGIE